MLCGTQTGVIRVSPLEGSDLTNTSVYWELSMHDNHAGSVTAIDVSFDGGYVISVGKSSATLKLMQYCLLTVQAEIL